MKLQIRNKLIEIAKDKISNKDPSHDFDHALRVLANAETIAKAENANLNILIPSALFHDLITYQKNHPERYNSQKLSADLAEKILRDFEEFSDETIENIKTCILECSFSKGIMPNLLESKIIQDADGLEACGAISIMRTFSSTAQMMNKFYNSEDPFCENRKPQSSKYGLDLFFERLLIVADRMHTKTAKEIALRRTIFLRTFLDELRLELNGQ